ncbi:MAG: glycosyltransferase family 4 protein [Lentisphaerae bacterium]|nr:glycosyltransferase family 4 protein [Lentisphaerota bacterium]
MSKKVLLISPQPFFQWRGSPIRVAFNVQALSELGYEVDLLTMPFGEDKIVPGVNLIRIPNYFKRSNIPIGPSLWKAIYDVILFFTALKMAKKNKYSVVHGVEEAGLFAIAAAGIHKSKVVYEKHSDPSSYKKGILRNLLMWLYGSVEKFMVRKADAIIGTGPGLVEQARVYAKPDTPVYHIFDIPSSLVEADPAKAASLAGTLRSAVDEVLVAYVGSFAVYQGVDLLFQAIELVVQADPKVKFVIVGGTKSEIALRLDCLKKNDHQDNVLFLGTVPPDELPAYLLASDILVSPRISGVNTPLKLLDYLKAGKPVVATDLPCNHLILNEETAVFAQPIPDEFAGAIIDLATNPDKRNKLGANARKLIDELYNYTEYKKRLGVCYSVMLDSHLVGSN